MIFHIGAERLVERLKPNSWLPLSKASPQDRPASTKSASPHHQPQLIACV